MKRKKRKIDIFSFENIYNAYLNCRKNKRGTVNALKFEKNLEENLFELQKQLQDRTYHPGRSICFAVNDPTLREIFAADFRDRIVHHLLVNQVECFGERTFIYDSFACRRGKGMHEAVKRLHSFCLKASCNYRQNTFYAQLDVSGFFMSIDHYILYEIFTRLVERQKMSRFWKEDILWLGGVIIFHKPTENYIIKGNKKLLQDIPARKSLFSNTHLNKGLPIGNYSSQFFGNLFLNELDFFVKRNLKCRYYVRYVDDFIILDADKNKLKELSEKINNFLQNNLGLELNPVKTKIKPIEQGIDFLGYVLKKDYILSRKRVVKKMKKKAEKIKLNNLDKEIDPWKEFVRELSILNSYYGHMKHADAYNLKKYIFENFLMNFRPEFKTAKNFMVIEGRKKFKKIYMERTVNLSF